ALWRLVRAAPAQLHALRLQRVLPFAPVHPARLHAAPALPLALRFHAAHHASRAVHGGIERVARRRRFLSADDHRIVAHRSADEAELPGERGRRALADDEPLLAVVLFPPGEVVVVVDAQLVARAEDAQHAVDDPVTAGIGILAGDVHRCEIAVGERRAELNRGGRRVHAVIDALAPLLPARQREKSGRGLVAEAARAEVDADPEPAGRAILE